MASVTYGFQKFELDPNVLFPEMDYNLTLTEFGRGYSPAKNYSETRFSTPKCLDECLVWMGLDVYDTLD